MIFADIKYFNNLVLRNGKTIPTDLDMYVRLQYVTKIIKHGNELLLHTVTYTYIYIHISSFYTVKY